MSRWAARAHWLLQRVVLAVPGLSQARLGADRALAFLRAWHYLHRAGVRGDYLEFGVYEGLSFDLSLRAAARFFTPGGPDAPRFFALDSFQGLSPPDPTRDSGAVFHQGEYSASEQTFRRTIRAAARGWTVEVVPGFFDRTLTPALRERHALRAAAFVTIDCDLHGPTLDALRFVTPLLQTGTVLYFDDWYFSGGSMARGEAGACADWLAETPGLRLADFGAVGVMGRMFLVQRG